MDTVPLCAFKVGGIDVAGFDPFVLACDPWLEEAGLETVEPGCDAFNSDPFDASAAEAEPEGDERSGLEHGTVVTTFLPSIMVVCVV